MAKILVVDDSEKSRKFAHTVLTSADHEVLFAEDAFSAIELLDQFKFDLLVLDVNMPFRDGFTALKNMRATRRFKHLPVVFMTGRSSKRDIEKAISLDAEGYILKPVEPEEFLEKINKVLSHKRNQSLIANIPPYYDAAKSKMLITSEAQIIKVTEIGIEILVGEKLKDGQEIQLNSPLLSEIGINTQSFRVLSCETLDNGYHVRLTFIGLEHESVHILKEWLMAWHRKKSAS